MKAIHAHRSIKRPAASTRRTPISPGAPPAQVSEGFSNYRVKVDADGREHFAVPLTGPKHKPGMPYLVAHFSLPPPNERGALIDELVRIFARSAVDELLQESLRDPFTD